MNPPITYKMLIDWAGQDTVRDAETLVNKGLVLEARYEAQQVSGAILYNNRPLKTHLTILSGGLVENHCPCYANRERGLICAHVIALALSVVRRNTDPLRDAKYKEELRRASRLANVDESAYIRRVAPGTPGALPASITVTLGADWTENYRRGAIPVSCALEYRGHPTPLDSVRRDQPYSLSREDEAVLFVLEDISEGPARGELPLSRSDFVNVVRLHAGRELKDANSEALRVGDTRLTTYLQMDLDRENGELILIAHTEVPFMKVGKFPVYCVDGKEGWVYGANHFWPLEKVLPRPYHPIYDEPVIVARPDVLRFLKRELPELEKTVRIESDISEDLLTVDPAQPRFRLEVRGSPASLAATLYAQYDELELVAAKPDAKEHFAIPDESDLMRYTVRNPEAESAALRFLAECGFRGECGDDLSDIVGQREVLNFLGTRLPWLRRHGWRVELEGRVAPLLESTDFATPVVRVDPETTSGQDWFDVSFCFEYGEGLSLTPAEVQRAIQMGDAFVQRNGQTILVDTGAVEAMRDVFSDCATGESDAAGHFRLSNIYAPFVKSSLDALDGIDIEDTRVWRMQADRQNRTMRLEETDIPRDLAKTLRPYQKDGVNWLHFLENNGFCGILADEMGLGKTLQALAWLRLPRRDDELNARPALIVCPTSLVENWQEEAARFAPDLRVMPMSGAERHELWDELDRADVVVTSYALLRRDIDEYRERQFSCAILDEAQHIKNRSTQNAKAAKQIRAAHRLVLTGTPVENGVADLWSIMDFLMPQYLGRHDAFRQRYELPIARGGPDAQDAQLRLRRKLHPFLLRRLKRDVAKELPPKIEKVSFCKLTSDQRAVYSELLKSSQQKISGLVAAKGFNRCRMEVLTTLLRLRQTCCHMGLLKLPGLDPEYPSGKMELFSELVDEALDSGHRILVFSQFVKMLHILRDDLDGRGIGYCYLDGSTKDRMQQVRRFNTQRDIPLFLISLKAGGTGLNLTGADMVIHFDPWWNPAVENQATDRAYRIGQKRTVFSHKLITKGTVEEKVLELQKRKKAIIDATVESDDAMVKSMSWEDVQELLSL